MAVETITVDELMRLVDSGAVVNIVDVRTPAEFARVHARNARSVPLDALDPVALAPGAGTSEPIYVICQSGARATKACERLHAAGIARAICVEGGTAAWERAGLPVERGSSGVISLERQVRIGAGLLVLIGAILAWLVHPYFLAIPLFIGAGLVFAGVTDHCGMAMLLAKMPWNSRGSAVEHSDRRQGTGHANVV